MTGAARSTALAGAAVLVAAALGLSDGNFHPVSLGLVTAAGLLAALAALGPRRAAGEPPAPDRGATAVLAAAIAASLAFDAAFLPGLYVDPARLGGMRPALAVAAALVATHAWRGAPAWLGRARLPALVAVWCALALMVLRAAPSPWIDVFTIQHGGASALSRGLDPYSLAYRNPYPPDSPFLAPEMLSRDRAFIRAYPYPPLVLLLGLPAALLGDVRVLYVLATALAALAVHRLGGRGRLPELAATLLLFQPRTLLVMEQSWTEPLVLAAVCALAVATRRAAATPASPGWPRGWPALGLAAGVALAAKQYTPLLVAPFWLAIPERHRWRAAALAAGVAALVYAPFLAWDPPGLWRGLVAFQLAQPFREDALSWPAAVVAWGGPRLPPWPAFVAAIAVAVLAGRRVRAISDALAAGALAWLVLVIGNKQAFCNYYWLAVGLLCAAVAAAGAAATPAPATATDDPPRTGRAPRPG